MWWVHRIVNLVMCTSILVFLGLVVGCFLLVTATGVLEGDPGALQLVLNTLFNTMSSLCVFLPRDPFVLRAFFGMLVSTIMYLVTFNFEEVGTCLGDINILFYMAFLFNKVVCTV